MSYPRVLHVGFNPIGSQTNTGLTLAAMFGGWPPEHLFELYTVSRQQHAPGPNTLLTSRWVAPFDAVGRSILGSRIPSAAPDGMNNSIRGRHAALPLRYRLRAAAATLNEVGPVTARGGWLEPVERFQPQVIHSLLGGVRITKFVARLADRLDLPVVPHFMDDWPDNLFRDGQLFGAPRSEAERSLARIMRRAPIALTIGSDMRQEFENRFRLPCQVVGNSADFDAVAVSRPAAPVEGSRSWRYAGGLHLGRDRVLARVAEALRRTDQAARLTVHAGPSDAARLAALASGFPEVVVPGEFLPPDEVLPTLARSDALVFVESDAPEVLSFTRLSVSTKVPEYLAARRPVLVVGPTEQSSVRALMASGAAAQAIPDDLSGIDAAVRETVLRVDEPLPLIPIEQLQLFGRHETQERLRVALDFAAGLGPRP